MLTERPFTIGGHQSVNIALDGFLPASVPDSTAYLDAIDRPALEAAMHANVGVSPITIIEGPIAWPLVQRVAITLGQDRVRRVYIKRMMRLKPDFWLDEHLLAEQNWPSPKYFRSINEHHANEKPWLKANLVLERVVEDVGDS